jgi:CheY-like chemotaxis protein
MKEETAGKLIEILLVEDNLADVRLAQETFGESRLPVRLHVARDGIEALDFLRREGAHAAAPRVDLVLLDLNLPRKDGRQVLAEVKSHPALRTIPVVVLTVSQSEADILRAYDLNADGYLPKPVDLDQLVKIARNIESLRPLLAGLAGG